MVDQAVQATSWAWDNRQSIYQAGLGVKRAYDSASEWWNSKKQRTGGDMNHGGVGPQTDQGEVGTNKGTITGKEMSFNDGQPFIVQSVGGNSTLDFTVDSGTNRSRGLFTFHPNNGSGGWNSNFLTLYSTLPQLYNYYELLGVEFVFYTGAGYSATTTFTGMHYLQIVPWTAQYEVGSTFPSTDFTLLKGCEVVPVIIRSTNQTQVQVENLQQQYRFRIKPQFQQNSSGTNQKGQYAGGPIQIQDQDGTDNTEWYGFLFGLEFNSTTNAERIINLPYYYRITVMFSGRRFSTVSLNLSLFEGIALGDYYTKLALLERIRNKTTTTMCGSSKEHTDFRLAPESLQNRGKHVASLARIVELSKAGNKEKLQTADTGPVLVTTVGNNTSRHSHKGVNSEVHQLHEAKRSRHDGVGNSLQASSKQRQ